MNRSAGAPMRYAALLMAWAIAGSVAAAAAESSANGGTVHDTQQISVTINRNPTDVYEFASKPENLPKWAAGLARSEVKNEGDAWAADSPLGKVRIRFAKKNTNGVMDHDVTLESGVTVHNPMRVVPNGEGSELTFTLIRRPGMSDMEFAADKAAVENDLRTLKDLMEGKTPQ